MQLCSAANCLFYIIRQNGIRAGKNRTDVFIFYKHIMQCTYFTHNFVVHCDNTGFKSAAELQVRSAVFKKQNISRITADVYYKYSQCVYNLAAVGNNCRKSLRKYHYMIYYDIIRLVFICKLYQIPILKVISKFFFQSTVMFRRQTDA